MKSTDSIPNCPNCPKSHDIYETSRGKAPFYMSDEYIHPPIFFLPSLYRCIFAGIYDEILIFSKGSALL
jgi:hypothetical protein